MKKLLLFLFLFSLSSAQCTQTTTALLTNSTTTLDFDECLNITDIGAMIYIENIKQNNIIEMLPEDSMINTYTNSTYNCNHDIVGVSQNLSYDGLYENEDHEIYIQCPIFPTIDEEINITGGEMKSWSSYNLTINGIYKDWGINTTLQFEGSYLNSNAGIYVYAPPFPLKNETINVDICGFYRKFSDIELEIKSPSCSGGEIDLQAGESYEIFGVTINAPPKYNAEIEIEDRENWTSEIFNISISCITPFDTYDNFCKNQSAEFISKTWHWVNLTNYTCNNYAYLCIDELTEHCSYDERVGDSLGLVKCVNRIVDEDKNLTELYKVEKDQCIEEKDQLSGATDTMSEISDNSLNTQLLTIGIFIFFGGIALFAYRWGKNQNKKGGSNNTN